MLGVMPGADVAEVKAAWHAFAHRHHPDRGGDPQLFVRGADAYEVLMNATAVDRLLDSLSVAGFVRAVRGRRWLDAGLHVLGAGFVLFRGDPKEPR